MFPSPLAAETDIDFTNRECLGEFSSYDKYLCRLLKQMDTAESSVFSHNSVKI